MTEGLTPVEQGALDRIRANRAPSGRDVIQIAAGDNGALFALCADRSMWVCSPGNGNKWKQCPPIPDSQVKP